MYEGYYTEYYIYRYIYFYIYTLDLKCKPLLYENNYIFNNEMKNFFYKEHMFSFDLCMAEREIKDDNEIKKNYNNNNYIKRGKYK